jgi:hypothetical protein
MSINIVVSFLSASLPDVTTKQSLHVFLKDFQYHINLHKLTNKFQFILISNLLRQFFIYEYQEQCIQYLSERKNILNNRLHNHSPQKLKPAVAWHTVSYFTIKLPQELGGVT